MLSWPSWNRINNGARGTKYRLAIDGFIVSRSLGGPNAKRYITWRARNVNFKAKPFPSEVGHVSRSTPHDSRICPPYSSVASRRKSSARWKSCDRPGVQGQALGPRSQRHLAGGGRNHRFRGRAGVALEILHGG